MSEDDNWRTVEVPNEFRVDIPPGAQTRVEDGATFVIRLPTESTQILISRYDHGPEALSTGFLEGRVNYFLSEVVPQVTGGDAPASVARIMGPHNVDVAQGVAKDSEGRWWLVRAYDAGRCFFWLQWTGFQDPRSEEVLRVFESFIPAARWRPASV
jgi:hypothetical protein